MLRCLIVDDEPLALKLLTSYLAKVPGVETVAATGNVFEALALAQNGAVDLVFLDIQMPELTGIQFMKILNGKCAVILTTAYQEYALQGFEHDVVDYLLKPFSLERLMVAINKAKNKLAGQRQTPAAAPPDYFFVKSEHRMVKVALKDTLYLEGLRDYVAVHTAQGKLLTLQPLRSFEESLPADSFIRIHKSYIVAIGKITAVEKKRVLVGEAVLAIGDTYLDAFRNRLALPE